jgi:hypothetical protein
LVAGHVIPRAEPESPAGSEQTLAWAWALSQSFPSSELRGMSRGDPSDLDRGARAVEEYDRKHGIRP